MRYRPELFQNNDAAMGRHAICTSPTLDGTNAKMR